MKYILSLLFFILLFTNCSTTNILQYKNKTFYTEENTISNEKEYLLRHLVCYDEPRVMDEEHCHALEIKILDVTKASEQKILDVAVDTSLILCSYTVYSIWNWADENNQLSGTIEILKWETGKVVLKEDIQINDIRRERIRQFRGTRTFFMKETEEKT